MKKVYQEQETHFPKFDQALRECCIGALDFKTNRKVNKERIAAKIDEYEKKGKKPGYAYLTDLVRGSCRFFDVDDAYQCITKVATKYTLTSFKNRLLGPLRQVMMTF